MMDHLCKYWGIDEIRVPFLLDKAQMGRIEELSQNAHFNDFKAFPEGDGWKLRNDDVLEGSKGADHSKKPAILQAWLFFGLIAFILRTDIALLTFDDLTSGDHQTKFLTTKNLPEKLQKWHDWIKNTTHDKAKLYERLIDADRALEIARKNVASVNFEERPKSEVPISLSGSAIDSGKHARSDSADYDYEDNDDDASNYESDPHKLDNESKQRLELCLMVLGETLSAAKIHIMKDLGLKINGWFIDDDEGWGPPSYILTRMRESHWCLRLQTVLRGQLGSSAILLCAAWANHSEDYSNDEEEQHKDCKESQCLHVQGQKAGQGSGSDENRSKKGTVTYDPQHHGDCQQRWACELLGPTMKDVYSILDCADLTREAHDFPLFRIISEGVTSGKSGKSGSKVRYRVRGITVEKWDRQEGRSLRRPNFATISHVWSQGMGNGRANSLQACQLEFIKSALEKTEIEGLESPEPEFFSPLVVSALKKTPLYWKLSKPFWLDTLGIPVVEDGADEESSRRNTERKQRAIRQIYHIFNSATCSIIIDKELCKVSDGLEPSQILIRVLTSPWMRRLWTLQEAFLSRRLCVALTHSGNVILSDLDQLVARLDGTNKHMDLAAFNLSMGELIKRKLYYNLMGEDRKIRNRKEHPVQTRGSMVIASAWHSTRWRVSHIQVAELNFTILHFSQHRD
jgi:hypothetical protein